MPSRFTERRRRRRVQRHVALRARDPARANTALTRRFQSFTQELRRIAREWRDGERTVTMAARLREMDRELRSAGEVEMADLLHAEAIDALAAAFDRRLAILTTDYESLDELQ